MNAESARMTKIYRRLAWQRIEREEEKLKKKGKRSLRSKQNLWGRIGHRLSKTWELAWALDGGVMAGILLLLLSLYILVKSWFIFA